MSFELRPTFSFQVWCSKSEPPFKQIKFDVKSKSQDRKGWINFENQVVEQDHLQSKEISIPFVCPACGATGSSQRSATTNIPHFQDVTLLSFVCETCGFKTNEVKADSGQVSSTGKRWELKVLSPDDMHRDLIKSKTAKVEIPELGFEMVSGSLGGLYTTVEGLLKQIHDRLRSANPLARGDESNSEQRSNFEHFLTKIHDYRSGMEQFTIVMEDPMDQSFIFSTATDGGQDEQLKVETYQRTKEEDDECGLVDPSFREFDPEYIANLEKEGDPLPKPEDWNYINDDDLKHNRFANFEEALLQSLGVGAASSFMGEHQPWQERVQGTDFGTDFGAEDDDVNGASFDDVGDY
jgi:ZPR1 zinc finger protein